jgi:hypothetical protein
VTSQIDMTLPVTGAPTTASVRANFTTASQEISALQAETTGAPFLSLSGGTMAGPITLAGDATSPRMPVTLEQFQAGSSTGGGGIPEAPTDGALYGRESGAWKPAAAPGDLTAYVPLAGGTLTGQLITTSGTPAAPGLAIGGPNSGFSRSGAVLSIGVSSALVMSWSATGGQLQLQLDANGQRIINLPNPTAPTDVLPLGYADSRYLKLAGGTVTGDVTVNTRLALGGAAIPASTVSGTTISPEPYCIDKNTDTPAVMWNAVPVGTQDHYILNGSAALLGYNPSGNGAIYMAIAPSGTAGAAISGFATSFTFYPDAGLYISVTGGDPLSLSVPGTNTSRVLTNNAQRQWAAGVYTDGSYAITDISGGTNRLLIDTGGNFVMNAVGIQFNAYANAHAVAFTYDASNIYFNAYVDGSEQGGLVLSPVAAGGLTQIGRMSLNGGSAICTIWWDTSGTAASWAITFSDRRLKRNIVPSRGDALATIKRIPVYEADVTPPTPGAVSEHWEYAIIADEIAPLIPAAYIKAQDDGSPAHDIVRELPLIATLIRAVQQLTDRVAALETMRA